MTFFEMKWHAERQPRRAGETRRAYRDRIYNPLYPHRAAKRVAARAVSSGKAEPLRWMYRTLPSI
jgi:hypothetical protein